MQMRFDGKIGFPGGLIDPGENVVTGLNRELVEEINLDLETHSIKREDFLFFHYLSDNNIIKFIIPRLSLCCKVKYLFCRV